MEVRIHAVPAPSISKGTWCGRSSAGAVAAAVVLAAAVAALADAAVAHAAATAAKRTSDDMLRMEGMGILMECRSCGAVGRGVYAAGDRTESCAGWCG